MFLKSELDLPDIIPSKLHQVILKTNFRGVITTNFDLVFERQSNKLRPLVYPQCLEDIDSFRKHGFFNKIHGCIANTPNLAENLILSEEGYLALRSDRKYQTILRSLFLMHPILTVGFSLRDPDFMGIIDDLTEIFREGMPTIYALMLDPGHEAKNGFRNKGVEIIPYENHKELIPFFEEMMRLSEKKHPLPKIIPVLKESQINYESLLEKWSRSQTLEESYQLIQDQINRLQSVKQKEFFLFQFISLVENRDKFSLSPHLIKLGTELSNKILFSLLKKVSDDNAWHDINPHPIYYDVHEWVLKKWPSFTFGHEKQCFTWLLDKEWAKHGMGLWETFLSLLNRIVTSTKRLGLDHLYEASQHIEGASEQIEKIIFAPDFMREDDPKHRWFKDWDLQTLESVRYEKFKRSVLDGAIPDYKDQIAEAIRLEDTLPESAYRSYAEFVLNRLFDKYVQHTHLTLHSSSGLYDPEKARHMLEVLADIKGKKRQLTVLWAINRWPERMRGLGSLGEDTKSLREGLFIPLWWRYSSEARVEYLASHKHGRMHEILWGTGQDFLLNNIMGLYYDIDKDFRDAFNVSLDQHLAVGGLYKYEPRPFQEVWRERELDYTFSDDMPTELMRRIAVSRVDWENSKLGEVRWEEARERAARRMENRNLADFLSKEKGNYVIDNLLGAYFPSKVEIVLYPRMIEYAAEDLGVDKDSLSTVVYIHETVHAYSHIGKDHDGRSWLDFSLPLSDQPDFQPSRPHEAIAQYYTFKLIQTLNDKKLLEAFLNLEKHCMDIYRAWRTTETYTLEDMRNILVKYRKKSTDWPPSF
jgi:hypothetical protein